MSGRHELSHSAPRTVTDSPSIIYTHISLGLKSFSDLSFLCVPGVIISVMEDFATATQQVAYLTIRLHFPFCGFQRLCWFIWHCSTHCLPCFCFSLEPDFVCRCSFYSCLVSCRSRPWGGLIHTCLSASLSCIRYLSADVRSLLCVLLFYSRLSDSSFTHF